MTPTEMCPLITWKTLSYNAVSKIWSKKELSREISRDSYQHLTTTAMEQLILTSYATWFSQEMMISQINWLRELVLTLLQLMSMLGSLPKASHQSRCITRELENYWMKWKIKYSTARPNCTIYSKNLTRITMVTFHMKIFQNAWVK